MADDSGQMLPEWVSSLTEKVAAALLIGALIAVGTAVVAIDHLRLEIDGISREYEKIIKRLDGKRSAISRLELQSNRNSTVLTSILRRISDLEDFKSAGDRFTADQGRDLADRIGALEHWKDIHKDFARDSIIQTNEKLNECFRRCDDRR